MVGGTPTTDSRSVCPESPRGLSKKSLRIEIFSAGSHAEDTAMTSKRWDRMEEFRSRMASIKISTSCNSEIRNRNLNISMKHTFSGFLYRKFPESETFLFLKTNNIPVGNTRSKSGIAVMNPPMMAIASG